MSFGIANPPWQTAERDFVDVRAYAREPVTTANPCQQNGRRRAASSGRPPQLERMLISNLISENSVSNASSSSETLDKENFPRDEADTGIPDDCIVRKDERWYQNDSAKARNSSRPHHICCSRTADEKQNSRDHRSFLSHHACLNCRRSGHCCTVESAQPGCAQCQRDNMECDIDVNDLPLWSDSRRKTLQPRIVMVRDLNGSSEPRRCVRLVPACQCPLRIAGAE
jgi:hypothetical protein